MNSLFTKYSIHPQVITNRKHRIIIMVMAFKSKRVPLLSVLVALLSNLAPPTSAFQAAPSIGFCRQAPLIRHSAQRHRSVTPTNTQLPSSPDKSDEGHDPGKKPRERELISSSGDNAPKLDPLTSSLTRSDEPVPDNNPSQRAPLFGEVPIDGSVVVLAPAVVIGVLGIIFGIVVALNSEDSFVQEVSPAELTRMEYAPTKAEEGMSCRGLCSSQEEDLDGLRNFMGSLSKKD